MGLFDGCLLACDIDGTLLSSGYMPPRNREKIAFFIKEGGKFSLCTGRTAGALAPVLEKLDGVCASVVANGSMIYDFKTDSVLFETYLTDADCLAAQTVKRECPGVGIEIHSGRKVFVLNRTGETDDHESYERITGVSFVDFETALQYKWNKVLFLFNNTDEEHQVKSVLSKYRFDSAFVDTSAEIGGRLRRYYEQIPSGVSKSSTLKILCEKQGVNSENLFAIGDYYNDLEMLKSAAVSACPEEAPDDIKAAADFVCKSVNQGAVADFIDYLTEIKREQKNGRTNKKRA